MPCAAISADTEGHVGGEPATDSTVVGGCDMTLGITYGKFILKQRHIDTGTELNKPVVMAVDGIISLAVGNIYHTDALFLDNNGVLGVGTEGCQKPATKSCRGKK